MNFTAHEITVTAIISTNDGFKHNSVITLGKGGPIIVSESIDESKLKFENALRLSSAIRNLLFFDGANKSRTEKKRRFYTDQMKERIGNVEYQELQL